MVRGVEEWTDRHREALILASLCGIVIIYLGCVCGQDWHGWLYYLYPQTLIKGLMLLCAYLAWKSYHKENDLTAVWFLLSAAVVILPFAIDIDRTEMLFEFCWCLLPILVVVLVDRGTRKSLQNRALICCADMTVIALLAALLCLMTKDFCIPILWLIQGVLWAGNFYFTNGAENRKRNTALAWLGSLFVFVSFTFMEVSYLSSCSMWWEVRGRYWNEVIYLAWPVLLIFLWNVLDSHIVKEISFYVQKISLIYFTVVFSLIYAITRLDLNGAISCFVYDFDKILYCLFLAELVLWNELYQKQKTAGSRIRLILFMISMNVGIFAVLFLQNERLREIIQYLSGFLKGNGHTDWISYRKAAFCAFLAKDTSVLDSLYKKEAYWNAISGHGIAGIWFDVGSVPILFMVFFAVLLILILWNWNNENHFLNHCAQYLAVGYALKMGITIILQANLMCSAYMEFPFTGRDIAESFVLGLLLFAKEGSVGCLWKKWIVSLKTINYWDKRTRLSDNKD